MVWQHAQCNSPSPVGASYDGLNFLQVASSSNRRVSLKGCFDGRPRDGVRLRFADPPRRFCRYLGTLPNCSHARGYCCPIGTDQREWLSGCNPSFALHSWELFACDMDEHILLSILMSRKPLLDSLGAGYCDCNPLPFVVAWSDDWSEDVCAQAENISTLLKAANVTGEQISLSNNTQALFASLVHAVWCMRFRACLCQPAV